jgi:hypothetical protein
LLWRAGAHQPGLPPAKAGVDPLPREVHIHAHLIGHRKQQQEPRMKKVIFALILCAAGVSNTAAAFERVQWPGPLVEQVKRLIKLHGDAGALEDTDGRLIQQAQRGPGDDIVLAIVQVRGIQGAQRYTQVLAVFKPEQVSGGVQHFRLIDFIRVGELGRRTVQAVEAQVAHDPATGETAIALQALEPVKEAPDSPGRKVGIQLRLKNDRLAEER